MARNWYVGTTKDQQETRAAAELRNQGYIAYLPKIHYRHQDGRKIEARTTLRFTGYIFICCEPTEIGPISGTRGMDDGGGSALLGGEIPVGLSHSIIETLRQIEDEEFHRATARSKPRPRSDLTPGDTVQIAGERGHPAYGQRGSFLGSEKGIASVLGGIAVWKVAESDLKKIEQDARKAA
jgi:hypothetical protein